VGITGFSGIAFQLTLILGFQVIFGFLYYWIGMLTSAFMVGLTLGAGFINKNLERINKDLKIFFELELAILLFAIMLPLMLNFIAFFQLHNLNRLVLQGIFLALSTVAGILVGGEFPLANKIYWRKKELMSSTGGALYAWDLVGASCGSILIPVAFIPILGIFKTCILVAILKLSSLFIIKIFT
jgi:spermidine synthase